jgi:hypothetical protein
LVQFHRLELHMDTVEGIETTDQVLEAQEDLVDLELTD